MRSAAAVLATLIGLAPFAFTIAADPLWSVTDVVTSVRFNHHLLDDLEIDISSGSTTAPGYREGYLGFAADASSRLHFHAPGGDLENLDGGLLRHTGGVVLELPDGALSLVGFELRPATPPDNFELYDAAGRRWLHLTHAHPHLLTGEAELRLLNMDLSISRELAERLRRPDLARTVIGTVDVVGRLLIPSDVRAAGGCSGTFDDDTDVALTSLGTVSQFARDSGWVAIAPSATLQNVGIADVPWYRAIAPDGQVGQHPYLVMSIYRMAQGRIQQIGHSDTKHTFYAVNSGCPCPGGQILFAGCADTYGASTNVDRFYLAPRDEVSAGTGEWESLGSHFDGSPVDDFRDHGGDSDHDLLEHRLTVAEADLETAGARYLVDAWYVVQGDIDVFNSMGYREVTPTFSGSVWTFPFADSTTTLGSVVDAWVDPAAPPAGAANTLLGTGEGSLKLAVRSTDLGGGRHRYEYALVNLDFDRAIRSFSLPIANGVTVSGTSFGDADDNPGNDWTADIQPDAVKWNAPAGNELVWGLVYNFGFGADASPGEATAVLAVSEPGDTTDLVAATQAPTGPGSPVTLSLTGTCPGAMTLRVSGGTPNAGAALLVSPQPGETTIARGPCAGAELGLLNPRFLTMLRLDANGAASIGPTLPPSACGAALQVLDATSCTPGNVILLP